MPKIEVIWDKIGLKQEKDDSLMVLLNQVDMVTRCWLSDTDYNTIFYAKYVNPAVLVWRRIQVFCFVP